MWINPNTLEVSEEPADGYETVLPTQPPLTGRLEKAVPGTPEQIDGMWHETWAIEPLAADEVLQVEEAERVNAVHAAAADRGAWKDQRAAAVAAIKVTTSSGNTFDGDETSQTRMARKIAALQAAGPGATADWVLADNSVATLGAQELQEALALASAEQDRIWLA